MEQNWSKKHQKLTEEFEQFRNNNNLDLYFKKYLSDDTRIQTL